MNANESTMAKMAELSITPTTANPSAITDAIIKIKETIVPHHFIDEEECRSSPLYNYFEGLNCHRDPAYIQADIRKSSLDKDKDFCMNHFGKFLLNKFLSSDPNDLACSYVRAWSKPGDKVFQFIDKKLGGDGYPRNVFPLNSEVDLTEWKMNQNRVYSHVKIGEGKNFARLYYGIEYGDEGINRPTKIFQRFELYKANPIVLDSVIELEFENIVKSF